MREQFRKPNMSGLLALLLFGIFAACVLSVLLMGADAYRQLARRDADSYDRRTAVQYLSTKVRQGDRLGDVSLRTWKEGEVLILSEEIDGASYETWVYCYDGYLRELFTEAGTETAPEYGEKILEAAALRLELEEDGQLRASIQTADGSWDTIYLHLRSGGEAGS